MEEKKDPSKKLKRITSDPNLKNQAPIVSKEHEERRLTSPKQRRPSFLHHLANLRRDIEKHDTEKNLEGASKKSNKKREVVPNIEGLVKATKAFIFQIGIADKDATFKEERLFRAAERYVQWLKLKQKNLDVPLTFPSDVLCVHRAHLNLPVDYGKTCKRLFGKILDLQKQAKKGTRENSCRLWNLEYPGEDFDFQPNDSLLEPKRTALVCYDFEAQGESELSLKKGDHVILLETSREDWWGGELNGKLGFFPAAYVQLISQEHRTL